MSAQARQFDQTAMAREEKTKLVKSLRRFDMVFFTICALVGLDTLGTVANNGPQGFTWLIVLAVLFVVPYMLLMAEVGSAFTHEGGPYEWVKTAFGRFQGGIAAVLYWITNPLWVGGSLAFLATQTWSDNMFKIGSGFTVGNVLFKLTFVWLAIGVAIVSLKKGKWIPNFGAILRFAVLGFFTLTLILYAIKHGVHGFAAGDLSPTRGIFLALVPLLLFNYVGFELQNGAAEEMENPQRDVPVSVLRSGVAGVLLYAIPIFGILIVLPGKAITNIGGFLDAVTVTFEGVYGGAAHTLLILMSLGFIGALLTSGAVWMIGGDRILAVAAYDGAFIPWFGRFSRRFGTPVRVNVMSGIASSIFCLAAIYFTQNQSTSAAFTVVLYMAISTTLVSYLWVFPAAIKLRWSRPDVDRPYRVPGGNGGMIAVGALVTAWTLLGSWVAVFPGTLEKLFGVSYDFKDTWGLSRTKFEVFTLGTLGVILAFAVVGYLLGAAVRRDVVAEPLEPQGVEAAPA